LASELGDVIEGLSRETGCGPVDVIGHSLGGLAARYLTESGGRRLVRRLVTLGSPYYAGGVPRQGPAIFGEHDPLAAPPPGDLPGRIHVVRDTGHLGLLYHAEVLREVTRHLIRPRDVVRPIALEVPEAA